MANKKDHYTHIGKYAIRVDRFMAKLREEPNGCKIWTGGTHRQGYGMTNVYNTELNQRQMTVTHRIAMMLHLGRELTHDEFVIHEHCDSQLCCNPDHMIVGDAGDRNRVATAKGHRNFSGAKAVKKQNRQYKYTDDEMRWIRTATSQQICEKYNITERAAYRLKNKMVTGYKWLN